MAGRWSTARPVTEDLDRDPTGVSATTIAARPAVNGADLLFVQRL
jgi:hypothetical protein